MRHEKSLGLNREGICWLLCAAWLALGTFASVGQTNQPQGHSKAPAILIPAPIPDPFEHFNRVMWGFNKGLMKHVVQPTAKVYRFVVRKPARTGINNFARNLIYPGRLINNLLESRWTGARDESYRFLCNTTVGVAGVVDVATKWNIPKADADFGQTFGIWGWNPRCFLMLPVLGPSSERDAAGFAADALANPWSYVAPYKFQPFTYLSPYTYFYMGATYNSFSDSVDGYVRFSLAEMDAYSLVHYAWSFARDTQPPDFRQKGAPDLASLETLKAAFSSPKNPEFGRHGRTGQVKIPGTSKKLPFSYWMQSANAPLVYIAPGLGSHRLSESVLSLAELAFNHGFSVVSVSSTFNYEFIEHGSTTAVPAYIPVDAHDLHVALTGIDKQLEHRYHERISSRSLMGYSMGAFESLFLAAQKSGEDGLVEFDRYVAIDTPVRLLYGISKLDDFYAAPLEWPAQTRARDLRNTFLKLATVRKNPGMPMTALNLSGIESKFLIGTTFRLILHDAIYTSQRQANQGILRHPISNLRRQDVYREILDYSYGDYLSTFLIPYYQSKGVKLDSRDALENASDLRTYVAGLKDNRKVRVIVNRNDFLLAESDRQWLQQTFTGDHLTVFEHGGHLGNLSEPDVQAAIVRALEP